MIELRDYQKDLLERAENALLDSPESRIMLQLPTGGGKTRIAGKLLSTWLTGGRKAVWLTHRKELASQTEGMLQEAYVSATKDLLWTPGTQAPSLRDGVVILMAQTVSRRTASREVWGNYDTRDLMIIDEAHHATAEGWARAISQWPGPVLGMTATPWRLSKREGFDHLFKSLILGPQVAELQSDEWLCDANVLSPPKEGLVQGGQVNSIGEYSERGIKEVNRARDIWTAGALRFWQRNGEGRQTVAYAVSVTHARNLADTFSDAGVSVGVLVANTPEAERASLIRKFQNGDTRVLINVAVATEGFDLPDAACILMTRPTMSLALYLQMAGRGLRPKPDSGDCVILDMAGNSLRHGLPDQDRNWTLSARGDQPTGDAPVVRCEKCEALSPSANHYCNNCEEPFGKDCHRCGAWRAWKRWSQETLCVQDHELVCDLCHYDAHVQARLPVTVEIEELSKMMIDDELSPERDPFLRNFLEEERLRALRVTKDRANRLRSLIGKRESEISDDDVLYEIFENHLATLPMAQRPQTRRQESRLFSEWEDMLNRELVGWRSKLANLESEAIDGQQIVNRARQRLLSLLEAEAMEAGLLPRGAIQQEVREEAVEYLGISQHHLHRDLSDGEWLPLSGVTYNSGDPAPAEIRFPDGSSAPIGRWYNLMIEATRWLTNNGLLNGSHCPIYVSNRRHLVSTVPKHPTGNPMRTPREVNSLYVEVHYQASQCIRNVRTIIEWVGQDIEQFLVRFD